MSKKTIELTPEDIEIERHAPGSIIRIFSDNADEDVVEDIITGLELLKIARTLPYELDEALKNKEQPNYLIMAYAEVKRINKESLQKAQKHAFTFLERLPKIS